MSDTVKIKVYVRTNIVGSKCEDVLEFDREEWDSMDDYERDEVCRASAFNYMEWGWSEE